MKSSAERWFEQNAKKPRNTKSEKTAAVLTIRDADKMTKAGRKRIAKWLTSHAELIIAEGHKYAPRFRGRYLYVEQNVPGGKET